MKYINSSHVSVYFIFNYMWGIIYRIGQVVFNSFFCKFMFCFECMQGSDISECCGYVFLNLR